MRGYLSLIWKDSGTCIHDLEVYVIKDFLLHETISRKLCKFLLIFSTGFTSLSVLLLSPLSITFFVLVFNSFSSNIDEVLSINPSANVFEFEDFNVHHKDWLTHSSGTDRPGELL